MLTFWPPGPVPRINRSCKSVSRNSIGGAAEDRGGLAGCGVDGGIVDCVDAESSETGSSTAPAPAIAVCVDAVRVSLSLVDAMRHIEPQCNDRARWQRIVRCSTRLDVLDAADCRRHAVKTGCKRRLSILSTSPRLNLACPDRCLRLLLCLSGGSTTIPILAPQDRSLGASCRSGPVSAGEMRAVERERCVHP